MRRKCHIFGARPPEARDHAQETHESCNCVKCHTFAPFMHARGALALARAPPFDRVLWTRREALTPRMRERLRRVVTGGPLGPAALDAAARGVPPVD